jgi:hypothetical protein
VKRFSILAVLAVVALAATAIGAGALSIDPGGRKINGNLTVVGTTGLSGVTTLHALDAGEDSKVGGKTIAAAQAQDGGTTTPMCQFGHKALTNGDAGVTFRSAFTSIPSCVCSHVPTTNANECTITTASTTAIGMSVQSADTDVAHYICCGDL